MIYKRKFGTVGVMLIALVVISAFGIAYAAFTQSLNIAGTATVKKSSWSVKMQNLQTYTKTGSATQVTAPTINAAGTTLQTYNITLQKPGDSITYTFDVANAGDYNAKLTTLTISTPTCTKSASGVAADATNVCSNLTTTLKYSGGTNVALNDTLNTSTTKTMVLTVTLNSSMAADKLPTADVSVTNLKVTLGYTQV